MEDEVARKVDIFKKLYGRNPDFLVVDQDTESRLLDDDSSRITINGEFLYMGMTIAVVYSDMKKILEVR